MEKLFNLLTQEWLWIAIGVIISIAAFIVAFRTSIISNKVNRALLKRYWEEEVEAKKANIIATYRRKGKNIELKPHPFGIPMITTFYLENKGPCLATNVSFDILCKREKVSMINPGEIKSLKELYVGSPRKKLKSCPEVAHKDDFILMVSWMDESGTYKDVIKEVEPEN